ncbi:uncharacterized protein SOCE836_062820 [Sorangium cellulosum]|uniref:Uncharacterized protein n=1 Tax=Sorangium cellulosum TaxID=56 RepID=A0A4P2QUP2_SORCE|nr:uncharacterized protein SOCE836_062820 [Sorangium cellulosum]WCQ93423.1 hypothetical protein NQZ70_06171 [Sorangium sp. Soce836]
MRETPRLTWVKTSRAGSVAATMSRNRPTGAILRRRVPADMIGRSPMRAERARLLAVSSPRRGPWAQPRPSADRRDRLAERSGRRLSRSAVPFDTLSRRVIAWRVGRRGQETTDAFMADVRARPLVMPQITSDGSRRTSLPWARSSARASTSCKRLCWVVNALRVTPAMQAGITDHVWTVDELAEAQLTEPASEAPKAQPLRHREPWAPARKLPSGTRRRRLVTGRTKRSQVIFLHQSVWGVRALPRASAVRRLVGRRARRVVSGPGA